MAPSSALNSNLEVVKPNHALKEPIGALQSSGKIEFVGPLTMVPRTATASVYTAEEEAAASFGSG